MGKTLLLTVLTAFLVLVFGCSKQPLSPTTGDLVGKVWSLDSAVLNNQGSISKELLASGQYVTLTFSEKTYLWQSNFAGSETKNYERFGGTIFFWDLGSTKSDDSYFNIDFPANNKLRVERYIGPGARLYHYYTEK